MSLLYDNCIMKYIACLPLTVVSIAHLIIFATRNSLLFVRHSVDFSDSDSFHITAYVGACALFYMLLLLKELQLISLSLRNVDNLMTVWWLYVCSVYRSSSHVHEKHPEHCKVFKMQFVSNCVFHAFAFVYMAVVIKKNSPSLQ